MNKFVAEFRFKYRPQFLAIRDFGHRITGNDKLIEEIYLISSSLLYYSDYARLVEHNMEKSEALRKAQDKFDESCSYKCETGYAWVSSGYNEYAARRAKNKKKVEEGRKLLKKFNLTMIKSREEERQLFNQLYRYRG
ncbi:MAG: hypothetical protein IJN91_01215 [Alphaproteobacteria bacterium]|nr:hypothetical protein [Alphaproteobacteria bacterium]